MVALYDGVAHGMNVYSRAAFRVELLSTDGFDPGRGTLVVITHRKESDVPLVCPPLYFAMGGHRSPGYRMHFVARDDMFLPGFFAGFPPDLPLRARRMLYRVGVGRWLPRVNVFPIRSASVARTGEVLAAFPERPLAELLPAEASAAFAERAAACGNRVPARAGEALRGEYADLLWRPLSPEDTPGLEEFWSGRAAQAAGDFRALVQEIRDGHVMLVYPEGRPSPDGDIGPIRPGIGALVRRGKPPAIRPLALAYDPLVRGRTRVHLALGPPIEPPREEIEQTLLDLLRVSMPLTCGQVVATRLQAGAEADVAALERDLADEVEAARDEGRPVEADLLDAERRRRRLAEALSVAPRRAADLPFLAREHASARGR